MAAWMVEKKAVSSAGKLVALKVEKMAAARAVEMDWKKVVSMVA